MRHYSKVLIELPDQPSDPPEMVITFDCDVCGKHEWRTHVTHLGTLARTIGDLYASLGQDDGHHDNLLRDFVPSEQKSKVLAFLNSRFPEWKASRILGRQ